MTDHWDRALRSALASARELEPTDEEVTRVLARDRARATRAARPAVRWAVAAAAVVAIAGGSYGVPPTRAAVDSVVSWLSGDAGDTRPGRALQAGDDAPAWVTASGGDKRLVAEGGGAKLVVVREGDRVSAALGDAVGLSDTADGWRKQFAEHKVVVLGPGAFPSGPIDAHGRRPLFGLTARSVRRVVLEYETGTPTAAGHVDGGFVLLADTRRKLREVVGYDASGRAVDRVALTAMDLRVCTDPAGC